MRTLLASAVAAAVALLALSAGGASGATGHAARTCTPPKYPGTGYFTSLTVTRTSCTTGKKVAVAYYKCRVRHGGRKGRCPGGVLGYRCTEGTRHAIPTEFNSRVTCRKGAVRIVHTYQQDT
jgi:hypothetical protein